MLFDAYDFSYHILDFFGSNTSVPSMVHPSLAIFVPIFRSDKATYSAFAALRNGGVVTWGEGDAGGDSQEVQDGRCGTELNVSTMNYIMNINETSKAILGLF